jgi:phosphoribosylformylglycinamidine (FGAM) synthase-like amidotransferase family enzyme
MPHPERAIEDTLGSTDGRVMLESFIHSVADHASLGNARV